MKNSNKTSRFKIQRRLGVELPGMGKAGALERRPYGPGVHGQKRKKMSDYALRLVEKQKLRYHYGIKEGQLINYVKKCKKIKDQSWIDTLVVTLEKRLDNVIFRLNFAPSIMAARQMVKHGHVLVNGKKINLPSYIIKVGDQITLTEKAYKNQNYKMAQETPRISSSPACYEITESGEKKVATLKDNPLPIDIPFELEKQLVLEFYWKID